MTLSLTSSVAARGPADTDLLERHSNQSGSGASLTVSTPVGIARRILFVTVKYTAAASVNVTITLNSGAGSNLDTIVRTIILNGDTDAVWIPDSSFTISNDDALDVFAPLLASQTSSVAIYSEIW